MESLLSDTHSSSNLSSREQSLDHPDYLQVPMLHPPDCNGTTFHLPDHCYEDAPLTTHYSDQEEDEIEEVQLSADTYFIYFVWLAGKCAQKKKTVTANYRRHEFQPR